MNTDDLAYLADSPGFNPPIHALIASSSNQKID